MPDTQILEAATVLPVVSQPQINAPLAWKTLEHIETHPEEWDQDDWRCGTTMCYAGHAAVIAGGEFFGEFDSGEDLLAEPDDDPEQVFDGLIHVRYRAQRVLGLSWSQADELFDGANELEELRELVARYTGESRP